MKGDVIRVEDLDFLPFKDYEEDSKKSTKTEEEIETYYLNPELGYRYRIGKVE